MNISIGTRTVRLDNGQSLGYREMGSGPCVLLLHGWPTSSYLWRGVMPQIAAQNRVIAVDLPGFGASDKPTGVRYGFDFFEQAIDGFLGAVGVDAVALAGHDLGGPIAVHWAARNLARVTRLALLNTLLYPEFSDEVREFVITLSSPALRDQLTSPDGLTEIMRLGVADDSVLTADVLGAVLAPFASDDDRLALANAGVGLSRRGFVEIASALPSLPMPVRVVYGEEDRILPDVAETMIRLQGDVPQTVATSLPHVGHFLQEESPDRVGDLLAAFFAP